jgi:hypothetical protein
MRSDYIQPLYSHFFPKNIRMYSSGIRVGKGKSLRRKRLGVRMYSDFLWLFACEGS